MLAPPATSEKLIALAARGADRILLAALSRLFLGQRAPVDPVEFSRLIERLDRYIAPELLSHIRGEYTQMPTIKWSPRKSTSPSTVEVVSSSREAR